MKSNKFKYHFIFWISLLLSWKVFNIIPHFGFFPFILWVFTLVILWIKKSPLKWFLIVFSSWTLVPFICFCLGINNYFHGSAKLESYGYTYYDFDNLNPEYRVYNNSSGCLVTGIDTFFAYSNNLAVKLCTKVFGYQKGAYSGFYPTFKQSKELINQCGKELPYTIRSGKESPYTIRKDSLYFQNYKLRMITFLGGYEMDPSITKVKMVSHKKELIIVAIASDSLKVFYLIDINTGENFAKYIANRENNEAY